MNERTTNVSREQIQIDWAERGYSCELWVESPGTVLSDFVHDTEELILLLDGKSRKQLAKLTSDQDIKAMGAKIVEQLESR